MCVYVNVYLSTQESQCDMLLMGNLQMRTNLICTHPNMLPIIQLTSYDVGQVKTMAVKEQLGVLEGAPKC